MPIDSRNIKIVKHGTPLRDAAVDPDETDFLPPVNAGTADPHGPEVYAPGIHALQDLRPVRPGPVASDPATQSSEEQAHATEWQTTTDPEPEEPEPEDPEESETEEPGEEPAA